MTSTVSRRRAMRMGGTQSRNRSPSRRGKTTRGRGIGRGPGRPRLSSYSRRGALVRKGNGRRGRSVGRGKGSSRKTQRGTRRGGQNGGPVLFRLRRGMLGRGGARRRPKASNSSNNSARGANTSENYDGEEGEQGEKPTASVWRTYTCVIS